MMKLFLGKLFSVLLLASFVSSTSSAALPQYDGVEYSQDGHSAQIFKKEPTFAYKAGLGLLLGGILGAAVSFPADSKILLALSGLAGVSGLTLIYVDSDKYEKGVLLATLDDRGITKNGRTITWDNLADIQFETRERTVPTTQNVNVYDAKSNLTSTMQVPSERVVVTQHIKFIPEAFEGEYSCDFDNRIIYISVATLPILRSEFMSVIKKFQNRNKNKSE